MFKDANERLEYEQKRWQERINEIYAAAGVPTPSTSLILWLEKLRQDSSILKEFENWLESKTHKEEGHHLRIKMEVDDYTLTHQAAVAATHRYLLEKLRAMLDNKGEKAKGENK